MSLVSIQTTVAPNPVASAAPAPLSKVISDKIRNSITFCTSHCPPLTTRNIVILAVTLAVAVYAIYCAIVRGKTIEKKEPKLNELLDTFQKEIGECTKLATGESRDKATIIAALKKISKTASAILNHSETALENKDSLIETLASHESSLTSLSNEEIGEDALTTKFNEIFDFMTDLLKTFGRTV